MVNTYNYLDVVLSSSSPFFEMAKSTIHKAAVSTGSVMSLMSRSKIVSWEARMQLYHSIVINSFSHCIPIWSLRYLNLLERAQVRFFKSLLHLPRCTPDFAVRLETGSRRVAFLVFKNSLNWLGKLLTMDDSRLPRICFNRLVSLQGSEAKYNWATQMGDIFSQLQMFHSWVDIDSQRLNRIRHELLSQYEKILHEQDLSMASNSTFMTFPRLFTTATSQHNSDYLTWRRQFI